MLQQQQRRFSEILKNSGFPEKNYIFKVLTFESTMFFIENTSKKHIFFGIPIFGTSELASVARPLYVTTDGHWLHLPRLSQNAGPDRVATALGLEQQVRDFISRFS